MDTQNITSVDLYYPPTVCISIKGDACGDNCPEKKCMYICPAGVFAEASGRIYIDRNSVCLECGACRLICDRISFEYPPAGRGLIHKFG